MDGMDEEKINIEEFKVGSLPTLFYIPNFVTDSEQNQLLNNIYDSPLSKWKSLKNRRLQNWGGIVHEKGLLPQALPPWLTRLTHRICERTGLFPSAINHVLINEYLPDQGIMPHQDGPAYFPVVAILSLGCPAVMNFTPHLKLKECGDGDKTSEVDTNCNEHQNEYASSILLMPCSLLIFKDAAYSDYLHGIEDKSVHRLDNIVNDFESAQHHKDTRESKLNEDVEVKHVEQIESIERSSTRISLTCRLVLKEIEFGQNHIAFPSVVRAVQMNGYSVKDPNPNELVFCGRPQLEFCKPISQQKLQSKFTLGEMPKGSVDSIHVLSSSEVVDVYTGPTSTEAERSSCQPTIEAPKFHSKLFEF